MKKIIIFLMLLIRTSTFAQSKQMNTMNDQKYWKNGATLVVSISMQFEAGGQPEGAESPFSGKPLPKGQPDFIAESWFNYGANEGTLRLLDLWDKHGIKVTSHIVGQAAVRNPAVVKAIADRGHEIAAHGMYWQSQWHLNYDEEKKFIKDGVDAVQKITGKRAVGYNCNWMRRSKNTVKILQELGFTYHIDDVSRDEPFFVKVKGNNFVVVPYTMRNNDIVNLEGKGWSPDQFLQQLKYDFDALYEEGKRTRRMMSISLHDRMGGAPAVAQVIDQFIQYAKRQSGVVFMRKDDIAKMIMTETNVPVDQAELEFNK